LLARNYNKGDKNIQEKMYREEKYIREIYIPEISSYIRAVVHLEQKYSVQQYIAG
jgi:hypothetical protein